MRLVWGFYCGQKGITIVKWMLSLEPLGSLRVFGSYFPLT